MDHIAQLFLITNLADINFLPPRENATDYVKLRNALQPLPGPLPHAAQARTPWVHCLAIEQGWFLCYDIGCLKAIPLKLRLFTTFVLIV